MSDRERVIELTKIIFDKKTKLDSREQAVLQLYQLSNEDCKETLSKIRDSLKFYSGSEQFELIELLSRVASSCEIDPQERLLIAIYLYNANFYEKCYDCFISIVTDNVAPNYRIEACKFLVGSEDDNNKQLAQEILGDILKYSEYPSLFRYETLCAFNSKCGISSTFNKEKIRVPYDEAFLLSLLYDFFYDDRNGIRERILSAQALLQMELIDSTDKEAICQQLEEISTDSDYDENTRADAADVLVRTGVADYPVRAKKIISEMGLSETNNKSATTRMRTIYDSSQNIHNEDLTEPMIKFVDTMINDRSIKLDTFIHVQHCVLKLIRDETRTEMTINNKERAAKSINRISIDTAVFTKHRLTSAQILLHVWARINTKYDTNTSGFLKIRLVDELADMSDTCGTGHFGRLINIFSSVEDILRISWEDQIKANTQGRINCRLRSLSEDMREKFNSGMIEENQESDERKFYLETIDKFLDEIYEELFNEFVRAKYIKAREFQRIFENIEKIWS